MRAVKIVAWVLGGLVGFVVLGAAALLLWVDPNDYRGEIERRVGAATGRSMRIAGDLDLKVFPWLAIRVADVTLGNPPGYGSEPFLVVKRADVGVKLLPLLKGELEVRRIGLEGVAVSLVSRGTGQNNWQDLISDTSGDAPDEAGRRTTIAGVDVKDATLSYRDEEADSLTRLSRLEFQTGALGGEEPVPVRLAFDHDDGTQAPVTRVAVEASLRLSDEGSLAELSSLVLKARTGDDGPEISLRSPKLVLDWGAETLARSSLEVSYGDLPLRVTAEGTGLFSRPVVAGTLEIDRVSPREFMPSLGLEVPRTRDPEALKAFRLKGAYRLTGETAHVRDLELELDDTKVRGQWGLENLDTKAMSFDLRVDTIDVDRYREPEPEKAAQGGGEPPVELPREAIRALHARGILKVQQAKLSGMLFKDVRLPIDAAGGLVRLAPSARLFGGRYEGDIALDARPETMRLSMNEKVRDIDMGALVKSAFDSKRVVGRGDANVALRGAGNTDAAMLDSLSGKLDVNVRDGALDGVDLWYELRRATALVKRTALPARTGPERTSFRTLAGSATLAKGLISNDDLRVDMDYIKARGKGTLQIRTQAVDYRLVAALYKIPPAGEGGEMADLKAVEIPISIGGTLGAMKVRPDVSGLVKARLRKEVDQRKESLKEDLKKELDNKLKDLFNR
jgi:AsmA protein